MCLGLGAGPADPHATVAQGVLTGTTDNGVTVFRGVPFAAPPVGDLRWAPPRPAGEMGLATARGDELRCGMHADTQVEWLGTVDQRVHES